MKRIFAVFAVLALMAGMAMAQPSMYGSSGLFRTISAKNAGPKNFGIGVYAYGWKFDKDSTTTHPYKSGSMDMAIVPSGYFSLNDMFELSFGTNFLMPSSYVEIGGTKTTSNPSGLGDTRVGLKFSYKLSDNFVGGLYAGYDIATLADTFRYHGPQENAVKYNGGIDARLLADMKVGDGALNLNAGMYYDMMKVPDGSTLTDTTDSKSIYPNMKIPFGLGFSYDMGMITPYAELSAEYRMDTLPYLNNAGTGTIKRGFMDNPMWAGGGVRLYFSGLNVTLGGEYNLLADSSANSQSFNDTEHWHAIFGLAYAPKAVVGPKVPPTAILTGKVTDAKGKGLPATITAGGLTANTDPATGIYPLAGLPITKVPTEIKAVAKLYDSKSGSVILTKKNKKVPAVQDFALNLTPIPPSEVSGTIIDYKTGKPMANATLTFKGPKTVTATTDANGKYTAKLEQGTYAATAVAEGYNPVNFTVVAKDGKPVMQNSGMVHQKEVFSFNNINFAAGKAIVTPEIATALQPLLKVMLDNPTMKVEIAGHTDAIGSKVKNLKLSQGRADAVVAWLITNNVQAANMTAKGYGSSMPIAENKTKAGRAQNRRIEIKVVE